MTITALGHTQASTARHAGGRRGLAGRRVAEVMSAGLIACDGSTSLRVVAGIMAEARIHCVLVEGAGSPERGGWGLVSDLDLVAASVTGKADMTAADAAAAEFIAIDADETLERAAQLMGEHDTAHLVVFSRALARPVGVISTLDIAAALSAAPAAVER